MKKIITMALVLVMAFGLAAPALAYTTNVAPAQGISPYTVDMYLVEYISGDILGGWITMPPTDRGYAKNEVIAGVGVLNVPANYDAYADGYAAIIFKGANVSLNVQDNKTSASDQFSLRNSLPTKSMWIDPGHTKAGSDGLFTGFAPTAPTAAVSWFINGDDNTLKHPIWPINNTFSVTIGANTYTNNLNNIPTEGSDKTYRFLVFGKVTGDDAKLSFSLSRDEVFTGTVAPGGWNQAASVNAATPVVLTGGKLPAATVNPVTAVLVLSEDFVVYRENNNTLGPNMYYVFENPSDRGFAFTWDLSTPANVLGMVRNLNEEPGDLVAAIEVVNRGVSKRMWIFPGGETKTGYRVHVEPSTNELVFVVSQFPGSSQLIGDQVRFGTTGYSSILAFYKDVIETKLGFSAYNEGNLLKAADWHAMAAAAWDVTETVDIEPWTPYVSVPENIVTDPPKTGDFSVMGFVLIAMAAAAAVVVRKVRA